MSYSPWSQKESDLTEQLSTLESIITSSVSYINEKKVKSLGVNGITECNS